MQEDDDDDLHAAASGTREEVSNRSRQCAFSSGCQNNGQKEDECKKHGVHGVHVGHLNLEGASEHVSCASQELQEEASQSAHEADTGGAVSEHEVVDEASRVLRQEIQCMFEDDRLPMSAERSISELDHVMHDADSHGSLLCSAHQDDDIQNSQANDDQVTENDCPQAPGEPQTPSAEAEGNSQAGAGADTNSPNGGFRAINVAHVLDVRTCESPPECASGKRVRYADTRCEAGDVGASFATQETRLLHMEGDACSKRPRVCDTTNAVIIHGGGSIKTSHQGVSSGATEDSSPCANTTGMHNVQEPSTCTRSTKTSQASSSSRGDTSDPPQHSVKLALLAGRRQTVLQTLDEFEQGGLIPESGECVLSNVMFVLAQTWSLLITCHPGTHGVPLV
jgi:hypothetical protein